LNVGVYRMRCFVPVLLVSLSPCLLVSPSSAAKAADVPAEHRPDAKAVQRYDKGYRYPQAGWVVLHTEGDPYPRGYQHGRLLAPEIAKYAATLARDRYPKDPAEGRRACARRRRRRSGSSARRSRPPARPPPTARSCSGTLPCSGSPSARTSTSGSTASRRRAGGS